MRTTDLRGIKFSKLLVLEPATKTDRHFKWKCLCDCGNTSNVRATNLKTGKTKSCGCLVSETNSKHNGKGTRLYQTWINFRRRCDNLQNKDYKNYGGRGIKYTEEWKEFKNFQSWANESGYKDNLTLERVNVDGNYEPENCKWVDWNIQASNKRKTQNTSSKYLGVTSKQNKWQSSVKRLGVNYYLGSFSNEIDAAKARDAFIIENNWPHKLNFKEN